MSLLAYAVRAVRRGFHVFPVQPGEKTPHKLRPDRPYLIRWSEETTNSLDRVVEIWACSPRANIGIACKPSRILVVDCDVPKSSDGRDGFDCYLDMCVRYGGDPADWCDTYSVRTGSGGLHLYYWWPDGVHATQASPVKGVVDIRCNGGQHGGYVLAAGSITDSGPYAEEYGAPIRVAPPALVEMCRERPGVTAPFFARPRGWGNMSGLIQTVLCAPDGNLNNALLWAARAACADGVPIDDAVDRLGDAYVTCGGRGGARQAEATIRSGYRLQERKT